VLHFLSNKKNLKTTRAYTESTVPVLIELYLPSKKKFTSCDPVPLKMAGGGLNFNYTVMYTLTHIIVSFPPQHPPSSKSNKQLMHTHPYTDNLGLFCPHQSFLMTPLGYFAK
jgi:hypothetical protein